MSDQNIENSTSNQRRGGFQKGVSGNPAGKPRGTKSRANQLIDKLFSANPEDLEAIVRATVKAARGAEPWAVEAILKRCWIPPKGRLLKFPLPPIKTLEHVAAAQSGLLQAVANGQITSAESVELSAVVERIGKALADSQVEERIARLEKLAERGGR
jgi:hypothetical protein